MKYRDRVQEYVRERGEGSLRNLDQARRECQDRERWKLFCHDHPLVGAPRSRHQNELNKLLLGPLWSRAVALVRAPTKGYWKKGKSVLFIPGRQTV